MKTKQLEKEMEKIGAKRLDRHTFHLGHKTARLSWDSDDTTTPSVSVHNHNFEWDNSIHGLKTVSSVVWHMTFQNN